MAARYYADIKWFSQQSLFGYDSLICNAVNRWKNSVELLYKSSKIGAPLVFRQSIIQVDESSASRRVKNRNIRNFFLIHSRMLYDRLKYLDLPSRLELLSSRSRDCLHLFCYTSRSSDTVPEQRLPQRRMATTILPHRPRQRTAADGVPAASRGRTASTAATSEKWSSTRPTPSFHPSCATTWRSSDGWATAAVFFETQSSWTRTCP